MPRVNDGDFLAGLSVVVPAYNEAVVIRSVIEEAVAKIGEFAGEFEVIVVDDGRTDITSSIVTALAAQYSEVRLVTHKTNRGYADALRSGFAAARFGLVAFTDADGQFDLADLRPMIPAALRVGLAVGYRAHRKDPWLRKLYSRGYNLLARTLCGTRARDCDCALKVFRRDVLQSLWPQSRGYFVNTEMLTHARQLGYPLVEFAVTHRLRRGGVSKVSVREIPRVARMLISFWWRHVLLGAKPMPVPATVFAARITVPEQSAIAKAA